MGEEFLDVFGVVASEGVLQLFANDVRTPFSFPKNFARDLRIVVSFLNGLEESFLPGSSCTFRRKRCVSFARLRTIIDAHIQAVNMHLLPLLPTRAQTRKGCEPGEACQ